MHQSRIIQKAVAVLMQERKEKEISDIGMLKGGLLAWLLWQERGVVNSVVVLGSSGVGPGV